MEKCCVIDIGTNSIRMLTAKLENGYIIENEKILEMTRIGEGVDRTKTLSKEAIERSIAALKKFKDKASCNGIDDIKIIATSAVRDAVNREVFLKRAKDELGLDIEVISGEREAELGFIGVINGIDEQVDNVLVIDIGGGSTEFVFGDSKGIRFSKSLNVGAVRMTDKHIDTDPISDIEMDSLADDIRRIIDEIVGDLQKFEIKEVAGIGGTATSLAAIAQSLEIYDREKVHNYNLTIEEISNMVDRFKLCDNDERRKFKGLQPKRADIILAGSKILYEILTALNIEKIRISDFDNLEGYIYWEKENINKK
ncbi:Ppx/GppA phosphatase family protein [Wukongibacter baidiensis]|uniref:Ppx/GppA phosphatase family protein n=1 Tax=Wukongibacter baidiensis TaxID=1723361 RepID=UPI003D7F5A52